MATKKKVTKAKPGKSIVRTAIPLPRGTKEVNLYFHVRVCCQEGKILLAVGDSPIEPEPIGLTGKTGKAAKGKKSSLKLAGGDSPIEPEPIG